MRQPRNLSELLGYFLEFFLLLLQIYLINFIFKKLANIIKQKIVRLILAFILSEIVMYLIASLLIFLSGFHVFPKVSFVQILLSFLGIPLFSETELIF